MKDLQRQPLPPKKTLDMTTKRRVVRVWLRHRIVRDGEVGDLNGLLVADNLERLTVRHAERSLDHCHGTTLL